MKSKNITVNSIDITVHSDGSVTKPHYKATKRTFGTRYGDGYMNAKIGGKTVGLHRLVAQAFLPDFSEFPEVDHIDGNKANNDTSNLRMATSSRNIQGHQSREGGSSKYRGVNCNEQGNRWRAKCKIGGKHKHLGCFDSEREAAIARDTYVFSQGFPLEGLNFPEFFKAN